MVRFAVIGTSSITREFIRLSKKVKNFELAAVYSRSMKTAERFATEVGAPLVFDDLKELARSDRVDAVYIASPNICHKEQTLLMIDGKKHVLVEKPAAPSKEDFLEMERAAKQKGVVMLEAMRAAFVNGTFAIKDALSKIGEVRRATISFCQYSSNYDKYKSGEYCNTFNPELANGSLMDLGVYCTRAAVYLFGEPRSVKAAVTRLPNGFDAQGSVICEYDGMLVELRFSKVSAGKIENEIQGEKGTMLIDDMFYPSDVRIVYLDGTTETVYTEKTESWGGLNLEAAAFVDMIEKGVSPDEYNRQTEMTLAIMDEVRRQQQIDFVNPMRSQGPNVR